MILAAELHLCVTEAKESRSVRMWQRMQLAGECSQLPWAPPVLSETLWAHILHVSSVVRWY